MTKNDPLCVPTIENPEEPVTTVSEPIRNKPTEEKGPVQNPTVEQLYRRGITEAYYFWWNDELDTWELKETRHATRGVPKWQEMEMCQSLIEAKTIIDEALSTELRHVVTISQIENMVQPRTPDPTEDEVTTAQANLMADLARLSQEVTGTTKAASEGGQSKAPPPGVGVHNTNTMAQSVAVPQVKAFPASPPPEKKKEAQPTPEQVRHQPMDMGSDAMAHQEQVPFEGYDPWAHERHLPKQGEDPWSKYLSNQPRLAVDGKATVHMRTSTWDTPPLPRAQPEPEDHMHAIMSKFHNMSNEQRAQMMTMMGMSQNQQGNGASSAASAPMTPLASQELAHLE